VYKIIKRLSGDNNEIVDYLVVNKYSGKIEYVASTIDEAKSYLLSQ
jgi:hypothetical protein